jgi:hypothetical protein
MRLEMVGASSANWLGHRTFAAMTLPSVLVVMKHLSFCQILVGVLAESLVHQSPMIDQKHWLGSATILTVAFYAHYDHQYDCSCCLV